MNKRIAIIGSTLALILLGTVLWATSTSQKDVENAKPDSEIKLLDAHGLAVDRKDSSKLYIATHSGLYMLHNDTNLKKVGTSEDDYMGFFYTSNRTKHFFHKRSPKSRW